MVLKIDMTKAYDSVDWKFLIHVLSAFGISRPVCCMFRQCISSPSFFVVMNGVPKDFFSSREGTEVRRSYFSLSFYSCEGDIIKAIEAKFSRWIYWCLLSPKRDSACFPSFICI